MRFTCDKASLYDAVVNVSKAVSPKSPLPVLEGVYLKLQDGELFLTGYDLELGIKTSLPVSGGEDGDIVLSARLFSDMLKRLSSADMTLEADDKLVTVIRGGQTEYTLIGLSAEDYPDLPEVNAERRLSLAQPLLKSMVGQTLFAVATTEQKPVHTGSLFDVADGRINVVSVDGYRLARRVEAAPPDEAGHFVVPAKTLSEILHLLSDDDEQSVSLDISRKHIIFDTGRYQLISRLLEGEFLDYAASIPKGFQTEVVVNTREFIDSLERASLLITERQKSPVRCLFEGGIVRLSCVTAVGKVNDEIPADVSGPKVEIGFNNRYLLDALRATESDEVKLQMSGALSPMKLVPLQGDSFTFLVLPVRLKSE